ncbi:uroplakin-3b-like protein 1 [Candoia aspera]|uniref:uroplakin-3b-like protein 1 n=1 Tax=Candoia aspera TaxID=51853 RepID=UPI002FD7BE2A
MINPLQKVLYGEACALWGPNIEEDSLCFLFPELVNYIPHLTSEEMGGKITASTFVLEQPRCVFNESVVNMIWLVVALSKDVDKFVNPKAPEGLPYQSFEKNSYYMTLNTTTSNYPCPEKSDQITVLRVGSETACVLDHSRPDCNGPLPGPGPYRVKFLVMNSTDVIMESKWSNPITLIQGRNPNSIVVGPKQRRTGTIIIATILSILFAILLAALIAALIYKYSSICDTANIARVQDPTIVRYTTHHIHDQSSYKL